MVLPYKRGKNAATGKNQKSKGMSIVQTINFSWFNHGYDSYLSPPELLKVGPLISVNLFVYMNMFVNSDSLSLWIYSIKFEIVLTWQMLSCNLPLCFCDNLHSNNWNLWSISAEKLIIMVIMGMISNFNRETRTKE